MRELFFILSGLLSMAMSVANMHHSEIIEEHVITIHSLIILSRVTSVASGWRIRPR